MKRGIYIIIFILLCSIASAYRPIFDDGDLVLVKEPGVSKAYYTDMKGEPQFYRIRENGSFRLYVNLMVPQLDTADKDFVVQVSWNGSVIKTLTPDSWEPYYDSFSGDDYWIGEEFWLDAKPGVYDIKVSSPDNYGKYVLFIGEEEKFGVEEIISLIEDLPKVQKFLGKPLLFSYFSIGGIYAMLALIALGAFGYACYRLILKIILR